MTQWYCVPCSVAQLCPTFWDSIDCNLPGPLSMDFPDKNMESVPISFSRGSSQPRDWTLVSCISCIDRAILYHCATCKAQNDTKTPIFLKFKTNYKMIWKININIGTRGNRSKYFYICLEINFVIVNLAIRKWAN